MEAAEQKYRQNLMYSLLRDSELQPITLEEIKDLWGKTYEKVSRPRIFRKCVDRLVKNDLLTEVRQGVFLVERFEE